ncbi:MAG: ski2-type helicase [Caldisphaera sp.]|nr:DEAD/DEAH box helicase [Caldisphaera sp.]PMP88383.1 MAG: ski2-type helicase [Caldisphaera sp.]
MKEITKKLMKLMNYESLFPPQQIAIDLNIENGESILVSSPTASGKTFIALTAIVNSLENGSKISIYTAPLRSIAFQKFNEFKVLKDFGYNIKISVGDYQEGPPRANVLITTYERLDSIIRNSPEILNDIGTVVIDEIHYVDDEKRGPILETLVSKILYKSSRQIVALSATVPNSDEIARWLNARLVSLDWRPVPLFEGIYKNGVIHFKEKEKDIDVISREGSIDLLIDISREKGQALIFSQSRRRAVALAKNAIKYSEHLNYNRELAKTYAKKVLQTNGPRSLREELSQLILKGVSYHHAGLSNQQRSLIEEAFANNALTAIFATPTLAAGVNLPARRVIIDEYYRYERGFKSPIKVSEYKQLAGRAGRPGLDPYGEAIIVSAKSDDIEDLENEFINGKIESLESKLYGLKGLRHSVLGAIASGIANDKNTLIELHKKTLYFIQKGEKTISKLINTSIKQLIEWGLVENKNNDNSLNSLFATNLGYTVSKTYLNPESVPILKNIISKIKNNKFSETIILYIISSMPDINTLIVSRSEEDKLADRILEDSPELIDIIDWMGPEEMELIKTMYALKDWINEVAEDKITENYNIGPGDIASLIDSASWISKSLAEVIEVMGLPQEVVSDFKIIEKRIENGVKPELLQLVTIPEIGRVRARRLYNAGYKNLIDLAIADPKKLLKVNGIGPNVASKIMEFFNRNKEAEEIKNEKGYEDEGLENFT